MTTTELETSILGYMEELYNAKYTGTLRVDEFGDGFSLNLYLHNRYVPIVIAHADPDLFLPYVKEEIRKRNYMREDRMEAYRLDPSSYETYPR